MPLHSWSPVETVQYPERSTRQTSSPSARRSTVRPSASRSTSNPTYSQPADSGLTFMTLPSSSGCCLLGTSNSLTLLNSFLEVATLRPAASGVLFAGVDDGVYLGDLRHGHVPEGLVRRDALVAVHRDVDDDRPVHAFRLFQGLLQPGDGLHPEHARAEALRVSGEIHGENLAGILLGIEADGAVFSVTVVRPEAVGAYGARERTDGREAGVIHENYDEPVPLQDRGDYLGAHHQVGAVSDHHVDLALGRGHLDAQAAGDLVPHARVAVLDVVALRVAYSPELVQIPRHRARRAHHHVLGRREGVDRPYDLALARQGIVSKRIESLDLPVPLFVQAGVLVPVLFVYLVTGEGPGECLERRPGVPDQRETGVFVGVEVGDVHVYEANPGVLESGLRGGGEVRPAGPDPDDEVGLAGSLVRGERARGSYRAQGTGMVVGHGALTGLRLADRDAGLFGKAPQGFRGLRVDHTPTGHDHGPARCPDELDRAFELSGVGQWARNAPDAAFQKLLGEVVGLGLDVLGKRQRHDPGLGLVGQDAHGRERSGDYLLGTVYPVPVSGDGPEAVVDREGAVVRSLELLQHGVGGARGEDVAGQEQNGQAVDGRERRPGRHVGGAWSYGGRAGERPEAVLRPGVSGGGVYHRLLVTRLVVGKLARVLQQRLAHPRDVTVAEDAGDTGKETLLHPVAFHVLVRQEPNQRLGHRQPHRAHFSAPPSLSSQTLADLSRSCSTSSGVGISSAHARREATMAPAALAYRMLLSGSHPESSAWQRAPPNASPAPSPLTISTSIGCASATPCAVRASTPSGPRLTIARSRPRSSSASEASNGSLVPTATSTYSWLPTATVAYWRASRYQRSVSSRDSHNIGR